MKREQTRYSSLFFKINALFLLAILPACVLLFLLSHLAARQVRKEIFYSTARQTQFHLDTLESAFGQIQKLQGEYVSDFELTCIATASQFFSEEEKGEALKRLQSRLYWIRDSSPLMLDSQVYITALNRTVSAAGSYEGTPPHFPVLPLTPREEMGLGESGGALYFDSLQPFRPVNKAALFRISTAIDRDELLDMLDSYTIYENGGAVLLAEKQGLVLTNRRLSVRDQGLVRELTRLFGQEGEERTQLSVRLGGEQYLSSCSRSEQLDLSIILFLPEKDILQDSNIFSLLLGIALLLSLLMAILFSSMIYRWLYRPLNTLVDALSRVEDGAIDIRISHRPNDEFKNIYKYFNEMVSKSQRLLAQIYEQQLENNRSQLKQLQSQINPHFLYNSLFIIYRLAKMEDSETIGAFSRSLGEYFRYMTRSARDEVPLYMELEHVSSYVEIQTIRFSNRIDVLWEDLPSRYRELMVPRLILQPVVENCYEHGFDNWAGRGEIHVRYEERGDCLAVIIENTGATISPRKVELISEHIQTDNAHVESTGIVNVGRRLRLYYGRDGLLSIRPLPEGGSRVRIALPLRTQNAAAPAKQPGEERKQIVYPSDCG